MKRLISLLVTFTTLTAGSAAWACRCTPPAFEQAWRDSALVFAGTALSIELVQRPGSGVQSLRVSFRVQRSAQPSQDQSIIIVETEAIGSTCGYPFEIGRQYFVYAARFGEAWTTDQCSRTKPIAWASDDLHRLYELRSNPKPK